MIDRSKETLAAYQRFLETPLEQRLTIDMEEARNRAITLFRAVSERVPAYRDFLAKSGVDPRAIPAVEDFRSLPALTKENYLGRHSLPDLCWDERLQSCDMVAVSSGSTGEPTFWPRSLTDELAVAARFEQVFRDSFRAQERRTLAVICFALGTWVGGMYTAACCRHLAAKGYPITVITPGNNKEEIYRVVGALGGEFDQVVLLGYPPFLKDVIDTGLARGVDWAPYRIKMVMAGEVFSEEWRSLMGERTGSTDPCLDSASVYGTADAGVLGNETPLSITIRRWLSMNPSAARELFREARLPTLVQYDPGSRYFEVEEGRLLFTGDNGVPLIRYNILDSGGILGFEEMLAFLRSHGFDPLQEARDVRPLPFVWVFGRSDFTVSYFGANVYPENVTVGLEQPGIRERVTGKFVLQARETEERDRVLSLVVELAPGVGEEEGLRERIAHSVREQLLRLNSEFANYVPADRQLPEVTLAPTGHPDYFPTGVKHRYTRK